jgi:hypothetical protein
LPEIERLCGLFCDSGEFLWRARKLMAYANGLRPEPRRPDYRSCQYSETPPLDVRVVLGRSEFDGPSAAADALLLAVSQPNAYFRTPSLRCPKEFEALWEVRFAQNPKILRLAVTAKRIATNYHSLSGVFIRKLRGPFEKLPDVLHDPKSRAKTAGLVSLFDSCTEELDPYSRYIGRNPGSEGSPQAGLYLPEDLWRVLYAKTPIKLAGLLHGGDLAAGRLGDILAGAEYPLDGAQAKEISFALQRLSLALKSLGVGIEPDGSLADAKPSLDDRAAIFALGVAEGDDGGNWRAAVDAALCCLPTDAPMKARRAVASCVEAPGADANRVAAYAAVAAVPASRQARAIRAASVLPDPARRTAARCAVAGVVAMGCGEPSAVKALEKLYDALGFPRSDLYGALHRGDEDGELAVARDAGPTSAAPAGEPGVRIDEVRLARAMESTSVVSRILADVFGEQHGNPDAPDESASAEASDPGKASKAATFEGLDPPHSALLSSLTGGPMDAVAFGVAARAQGLMPSGALDRINEWGFEQFDDMLVEEGEIFTISVHILPRLASVRNEN